MLPDKLASTTAAVEEMLTAVRTTPRLAARVRGKVLHYRVVVPFIVVAAVSIFLVAPAKRGQTSGSGLDPPAVPTCAP